ncbi:hypothetical protein KY289_033766 [Solanum tuberosum]|nr:hypothetical protein KY289_033766 [Solanum tuberosum]
MVARVSDFGISKLLTAYDPVALTKTLGTIGYMAPVRVRRDSINNGGCLLLRHFIDGNLHKKETSR